MSERRYIATKEDWEIFTMPEENATFTIEKRFTNEQLDNIKAGHIPEEMEDRWFSYFEDDKLYIHRSWSGNCIYVVEFNSKRKSIFNFNANKHKVTVNRDEQQYTNTDINEDIEEVSSLLDYFSR